MMTKKTPLLVFLFSFFFLYSFESTRFFLSDEGVILDQFYNLIHGSFALEFTKINVAKGVYVFINGQLYGKFSYSLLYLAMPIYHFFNLIDKFYGAHLFMVQIWALSVGVMVYLFLKNKIKYSEIAAVLSYLILLSINLRYLNYINYPKWSEMLSIQTTNILIAAFLILTIYFLFRDIFNEKISLFASFFILLTTPILIYSVSLKHHILALFLTVLAFYFFNKYHEKKDAKYIYLAYVVAGLCVWTRILDGVILLLSLFIVDIYYFRHKTKYIVSIIVVAIISLVPFFSFNYMILGSPFSVMEVTPLLNQSVKVLKAEDYIIISPEKETDYAQKQLLKELGYTWNTNFENNWFDTLRYISFQKLVNTHGVFLVCPFLILSIFFIIDRKNIKINHNSILYALYLLLFIIFYGKYMSIIVTDTPAVLEYRYLLIVYIILLYFSLKSSRISDLIENNLKKIISLSFLIFILSLFIFILFYPLEILRIYQYIAFMISIFLLISIITKKQPIFFISLSIACSMFFLAFYYWSINMTYIAPSQNHFIIPIMDSMIRWMYNIVLR